jgi:YidC/Oxa1 family membrane protein insertase
MLPGGKIDQPHLLGFSTLKGQEVEHTIFPSIEEAGLKTKDGLTWAAFSDQYFLSAIVGNTPAPGRVGKVKIGDQELFVAQLSAPSGSAAFSVYAGPKDYRLLKELGHDLHRTVDLGFFSFLAQPLLWLLRQLNSLLNNWGLSIIALTLLLKAAFLPLTKASFTSMKAMQEIAPEIKALRERISDSTQLNQEMIALYKRRGVNPLGGCFPVLIQIPVFLGLYNALLHTIELRHAPFALWIHDLSAPEWLSLGFISVPVLVILMTALMVIQQALTPSPDPTQKKMMMIMSLAFSFIFINFPAGLTLYWLINSLISVIQQKVITKGSRLSPALATAIGSIAIFGGAFILTKL